jgi:hypothetical protein
MSAAQTTGDKTRIRHTRYGVEMLDLYLDYFEATTRYDFIAVKQAYDAMRDHWRKVYEVNTDLVANEAEYYLRRFLVSFVEDGLKYSSDPYRIVYKIPDQLKTMFDPNEVGHRMRFQETAINDKLFTLTRTWSAPWDAQGLTGIRSGAVWYRVHFELPEDAKGRPIGLFVGGVEDEARVWVNGQVVGTSGRGFSRPSVFDLTDGIKYRGDNLLAIQVVRNSKANEIGLGGIIRPCFIFAGPRLETKAPKPVELRRVLPGGGLAGPES